MSTVAIMLVPQEDVWVSPWTRTCTLDSALCQTRHGEANRTEIFLGMVLY